jgi:hypothetical protein
LPLEPDPETRCTACAKESSHSTSFVIFQRQCYRETSTQTSHTQWNQEALYKQSGYLWPEGEGQSECIQPYDEGVETRYFNRTQTPRRARQGKFERASGTHQNGNETEATQGV